MKILQMARMFYHLVAFTIFIIQAQESLYKYFQYPVVIHKSSANVDTIEKPLVKVCFQELFDYGKASEFGYDLYSKFFAGMIPNSTRPTWKGIFQNSTFQEINNILHQRDFSKITLNQPSRQSFAINEGFCLMTNGLDDELEVTTKDKKLSIFIVHNSTASSLHSETTLGFNSNTSYDYKVYELTFQVHDNTIYEGITCVDYRKKSFTYRDCKNNAVKKKIYSSYGCHPPWIFETKDKTCEIGIQNKEIDAKVFEFIWKKLDMMTDKRNLNVRKVCLEPCYQIKTTLEPLLNYPFR